MSKSLTLTIVIPVYNEEDYLRACLDSIAAQSVMPDEVIVVDNNSTDNSMVIARNYKFVKIIKENRQHQSFAQAAGFNAAKTDILGRIDADSILPNNWVIKIRQAFENKQAVAVTGGADPYDVPMRAFGVAIFDWYIYTAGLIAGHRMLWGANCAIRRTAWLKVKDEVMLRPDIWEDYDLGFCLNRQGRIAYLHGLRVGVSFRAVHTSFKKHISYQFRAVRTFYYRADIFRLALFCLLWTTTILVYPLAAFDDWLYKGRPKAPD